MGEERGLFAHARDLRDLRDIPIDGMVAISPSALTLDPAGHLWVKNEIDPADTRIQWARVELHRKGENDFRVTIPWRVQYRWTPDAGASAGATKISAVAHYPMPWSRGLTWTTQRSRVMRGAEDWLSARDRRVSWTATGASWVIPFGLALVGAAIPQIAIFWLVWGVSNIPPIHSALTALWTRDSRRFAQPGLYVRPWELDSMRQKDRRLADAVPGSDSLPPSLYYRPRAHREKSTASEKVRGFFSDMWWERSTVPQFTLTMGVTAFGFAMKHFAGWAVFDPVPVLIGSWVTSQLSTVHTFWDAFQMKRHGATWTEVKRRIFQPTAAKRPDGPVVVGGARLAHRVFQRRGVEPAGVDAAPAGAAPAIPEPAPAAPAPGTLPTPGTSLLGSIAAPVQAVGRALGERIPRAADLGPAAEPQAPTPGFEFGG